MPPVEVCFDAAALSLTAAWAAGSTLALLLTRAGANAAKWGFRVFMLAVIVAYLNLPPAWPISWYGLAADLGLTTVALAWALGFAIVAGASLTALRRARRPVLRIADSGNRAILGGSASDLAVIVGVGDLG